MNSSDILNQIQGLQGQYKNLGVTDPNAIYQQFVQKAQGFAPQYKALADANTAAYAAPASDMQTFNAQSGNMGGPDAFARLNSILNDVGNKYGTANAISNGITAQQGNLQGVANSVYSNVNALGQNLQSQIGDLTPIYQSQLQSEAAQAQIAVQMAQIKAQQDLYKLIYGNGAAGAPAAAGTSYPGKLGASVANSNYTIPTQPSNNVISNVLSVPANIGYGGANLLNQVPGLSKALGNSPVNPFNVMNMSQSPFLRDLYARIQGQANNLVPGSVPNNGNYNQTIQSLNKAFGIQ